jgi:BirA family biotin operon repressor/biotin-[acetyl-CoA-carboxylase] ligase
VSLPDGTEITGRAVRLDEEGRLVVDAGSAEHVVAAGDVVHVRASGRA